MKPIHQKRKFTLPWILAVIFILSLIFREPIARLTDSTFSVLATTSQKRSSPTNIPTSIQLPNPKMVLIDVNNDTRMTFDINSQINSGQLFFSGNNMTINETKRFTIAPASQEMPEANGLITFHSPVATVNSKEKCQQVYELPYDMRFNQLKQPIVIDLSRLNAKLLCGK